jgi:hypothetical protein
VVFAIWCGALRFGDEAKMLTSPGSASSASSIASFRQSRHYTRCPVTASTPKPEGGARCVSGARRDLCGGRGVILVHTATSNATKKILALTGIADVIRS